MTGVQTCALPIFDSSDDRDATSRLSCQIAVTEAIDGLTVTVAKED